MELGHTSKREYSLYHDLQVCKSSKILELRK
jgi:hypothetical protein